MNNYNRNPGFSSEKIRKSEKNHTWLKQKMNKTLTLRIALDKTSSVRRRRVQQLSTSNPYRHEEDFAVSPSLEVIDPSRS